MPTTSALDPDGSEPGLQHEDTPQGRVVRLLGRWTVSRLVPAPIWEPLLAQLSELVPAGEISWDLSGLQRLDHIGAQLLWNHWGRRWPPQLQMVAAQRSVLERVARYSAARPQRPRRTLWQRFTALGALVWRLVDHLVDMTRLLGQLLLDILRLARRPREGPWRDVTGHIYHIGSTALPITALVGFLIGLVLAYLTSQQLKQFGADAFIVNILGLSLIRELGPMLAAILVAGRSGSAITAQIGVMRVTEELDAMRVMGIPHGFRLVMPRVLALAIAMPLISLWTSMAALLGGMLAADAALDISPAYFLSALPRAVPIANLWLATAKSAVFGILIALIGCYFGMKVKPNTESLGRGTTSSVVTSITAVILVDALFAVLFKGIGFRG